MTADTIADVIVAGGGPVGALLACELRLAGASVIVLEQLAQPSGHSRAFRLQPRTLELFDQRGLLEPLLADSKVWPWAHFAGLTPRLDLSRLDSVHPYALLIPQSRTEAALESRAAELGARIRRGHRLTGLAQDNDGVTARVAGPSGEYQLRAQYLVGCDGGRSTTRKAAGIPFEGAAGRASCMLGDVRLADPDLLPSGVPGTLRTDSGLLMAVSLEEGVTRILVTEFGRPPALPGDPVTLAELKDGVRRVTGTPVGMDEPRWLSRFSDASLLAANYRSGRVLLAGDAAHVHFPIGAQGLNLGLQDAMNLGWKLAGVVTGRVPDTLLDTYGAERRPAGQRVIQETRTQLELMEPGERVSLLREFLAELLALPQVNLHLARLVTGLDVRIPGPPENAETHPCVGARVPELTVSHPGGRARVAELMRDGGGLLVDLTCDAGYVAAARPWAGRVSPIAGHADASEAAALLIRPDGYIAWAAGPDEPADVAADGLRAALSRCFGPAGSAG